MIALVDLRLCCKRDHFFVRNNDFLQELLSYLRQEFNDVLTITQIIYFTNNTSVKDQLSIGKACIQFDSRPMIYDSWHTRLYSLFDGVSLIPSYNGNVLILSPFKGIITGDRINAILKRDPFQHRVTYAAMDKLDSNQNPVRFNILQQHCRKGRAAAQSSFQSLNFASMVKNGFGNDLDRYAGSQFVPELYAVDESLIFTTMDMLKMNSAKLTPAHLPVGEKKHLPLLYRLPIFHFHKKTNLII